MMRLCDLDILDIHIEQSQISFNEQFWQECLIKVIIFYQKFVLPELFTCRVQRGKEKEGKRTADCIE